MSHTLFKKTCKVSTSRERLWNWHLAPGAFERLAPPWERMIIPDSLPEMTDGSVVEFHIQKGPIKLKWTARIGPFEPPARFVDTQMQGPFASWKHQHSMVEEGTSARLEDTVDYKLPFHLGSIPPFSQIARREIERLFAFRHARMLADLERFPEDAPGAGKTVLVSGSTGLIGRRLVPFLQTLGYEVRGLTRRKTDKKDLFQWNPSEGYVDPKAMLGVDAIIHLAGENIASGRWTEERKQRILQSRIDGTRTLVNAISEMERKPGVFISASGVNYYGADSRQKFETSRRGTGFLSEVCEVWESEAEKVEAAGVRCAILRTGIVLDPLGGALGKMLLPFKLGLGGPIGNGEQAFPWIAMDDLLDIYERAMRDETLCGPINAVHPERIDQRAFSKCLGKILRRPAIAPLPAGVVKLLFGEMGEETLLADLPIIPGKLLDAGHPFRFDSLNDALSLMLGKQLS